MHPYCYTDDEHIKQQIAQLPACPIPASNAVDASNDAAIPIPNDMVDEEAGYRCTNAIYGGADFNFDEPPWENHTNINSVSDRWNINVVNDIDELFGITSKNGKCSNKYGFKSDDLPKKSRQNEQLESKDELIGLNRNGGKHPRQNPLKSNGCAVNNYDSRMNAGNGQDMLISSPSTGVGREYKNHDDNPSDPYVQTVGDYQNELRHAQETIQQLRHQLAAAQQQQYQQQDNNQYQSHHCNDNSDGLNGYSANVHQTFTSCSVPYGYNTGFNANQNGNNNPSNNMINGGNNVFGGSFNVHEFHQHNNHFEDCHCHGFDARYT